VIRVKVFIKSKSAHFSQLYCGLDLMQRDKLIKLTYLLEKEVPVKRSIVRLAVNEKEVYIDLEDSNKIDLKLYNRCDFYFKRMLLKTDAEKYKKLLPYGLNYSVMTENASLKYFFFKSKSFLKNSLKYNKSIAQILNMNDSIGNCQYKNFEREPVYNKTDKIVFSTRLWDPSGNNEQWKQKERNVLNAQRISIIKVLKTRYPNSFEGGVFKDSYSEIRCPNEVVLPIFSHKKSYLKLLKTASICVTNQGLEDSIGWKFAEYIANSAAILTTPIDKYLLLGNLKEGKHYLTFRSEKEFLQKLEELLKKKKKRNFLMKNNHHYYKEYLHPLAKMKLIINQVVCV